MPWSARAVLGPHRPPRPEPLPDPRAAPGLQRPQQRPPGAPRPHLHRQPLRHLLRDRLRDPAHPQGPYGTELAPPCPRPSAAGASSTGSSSPCGANTDTGTAAQLLQRRLPRPQGGEEASFPLAYADFFFAVRADRRQRRQELRGEGMRRAGVSLALSAGALCPLAARQPTTRSAAARPSSSSTSASPPSPKRQACR